MSPTPIKFPNDPPSDFSVFAALGRIPGVSTVNKFGKTTNADSAVLTDVWDGAQAPTSQPIYVPPTQPRIHDIASTSASDTNGGTGVHSVRIFGLPSWDEKEISEDVTMNGTTNVPTVNAYAIIHRMFGLAAGSNGVNVGTVTATAQTDATVTAIISVDEGQSLMAIYGVPSVQRVIVVEHHMEIFKTVGASVEAEGRLVGIFDPGSSTPILLTKDSFSLSDIQPISRAYDPPVAFTGPFLVKQQIITDTNDTTVTAGFNLYMVDV